MAWLCRRPHAGLVTPTMVRDGLAVYDVGQGGGTPAGLRGLLGPSAGAHAGLRGTLRSSDTRLLQRGTGAQHPQGTPGHLRAQRPSSV